MSRLQEVINNLIKVIVSYHESQKKKGYPVDLILKKNHKDMMSILRQLVIESTEKYDIRKPMLDYFLYLIDNIKPEIDKEMPIDENKKNMIQDHLIGLITNLKNLTSTSQTKKITINYGNVTEKLSGFKGNFIPNGHTVCRSGQLVKSIILEGLELPEEDSELDEASIKKLIIQLINDHQTYLQKEVFLEESNRLKEKNLTLTNEKEKLMKEYDKFKIKYDELAKQYAELMTQLELSLVSKKKLEENQDELVAQLKWLRNENQTLKGNLVAGSTIVSNALRNNHFMKKRTEEVETKEQDYNLQLDY